MPRGINQFRRRERFSNLFETWLFSYNGLMQFCLFQWINWVPCKIFAEVWILDLKVYPSVTSLKKYLARQGRASWIRSLLHGFKERDQKSPTYFATALQNACVGIWGFSPFALIIIFLERQWRKIESNILDPYWFLLKRGKDSIVTKALFWVESRHAMHYIIVFAPRPGRTRVVKFHPRVA